MNAYDLKRTLVALLPKRSMVVVSPPGCGKTMIIKQAAGELGADVIFSHPVTEDPTDAKGLPWFAKEAKGPGHAQFFPFGNLRRAIEAKSPLLWFIDDLGQGAASVQGSYMQAIEERRIGEHILSPHVMIVAATNRAEDRAGATKIITALASRMMVLELEVSNECWLEWALHNGIKDVVRSYIKFKSSRGENPLHSFDAKSAEMSFGCPRTWHKLSDDLELIPEGCEIECCSGLVGKAHGAQFVAFMAMRNELPDPMECVEKPDTTTVPKEPSVCYAVAGAVAGLAGKLKDDQLEGMSRYLSRLWPEYAAFSYQDAQALNTKTLLTKSFREWVKAHKDLFTDRR